MEDHWPNNSDACEGHQVSLEETVDLQTPLVDKSSLLNNPNNLVELNIGTESDQNIMSVSLDSDQTTFSCLELDNAANITDDVSLSEANFDAYHEFLDSTGSDKKLYKLNLSDRDSPRSATAQFVCMAPADGGDVFVVGISQDMENNGKTVPIEDVEEDDDVSDDLDDFPSILSTSEQRPSTGRFNDIDDDERMRESEETRDNEPMNLTPPPDSWHPLVELRRRELGHIRAPVFACRAGASVELARRLTLYHKLDKHAGCVNALHFNDSGTLLASGADDLDIIIWKWQEPASFYTFHSGHSSNVFQCKFLPFLGDTYMVSCARDGQVRLAEFDSTGVCGATKKLAEHRGPAHKISLKSDSSYSLYTCGEDAVVFDIDLREDKPKKLCIVKENSRRVELYSIHSNPFKSEEFCVGGRDRFVRIYDARMINESQNGGILKKFCPQHMLNDDTRTKANVTAALYNHDGTEVVASYNDEDIYLFENKTSDCSVLRYTGHRNNATVKGVNFYGPRSEFIVSGSDCGNVFIWEKRSQKIINYFYADEGGVVNVLEPHPHFPILATSGLAHDIKIWLSHATESTKLEGLERLVRKNRKERESDQDEPDVDGQMLWLLMHHLRRSAHRQMNQNGNEDRENRNAASSSDDAEDDEDREEEDDDDEEDFNPADQCRSS